jgi:zeta-carotene desaturase
LVDFDGGMEMVCELDNINFTKWFSALRGFWGSLDQMWDVIAYALGFLDSNGISTWYMLTIFLLFTI